MQNRYTKEKELRRLRAYEKLENERQNSQSRQQIFTSEQKLNTVRRLHSEQLNTVRNQHSQHETNMIDQWKKQHAKVRRKHVEHTDCLWETIKEKENEIADQREQHQ